VKRIIKRALANGAGIDVVAALMGQQKGQPMTALDFQYDPNDASSAWPVGSYEATITKVEKSLSREHKDPMLIITYTVYGAPAGPTKGKRLEVKDFITNPPKDSGRKGGIWKLRLICETVGLAREFSSGKLNPKALENRNLIVNFVIQQDPKYGDQNRIESYGKLDRAPLAAGAEDDDVPF
jgi:hypothetical protein